MKAPARETEVVLRAARFAVLLVAVFLSVAACSPDQPAEPSGAGSGGSATETTGSTEPASSPETTQRTAPSEATLGPSPEEPDAVLRLEGAAGTRFAGVCRVGAEETAIRGQIPKRYGYDLDGQRLTCRIQKRDSGGGSLKVILTAGGNTRSVQQTNTTGGSVEISYQSRP